MLAGPECAGVADDPEAVDVLQDCLATWQQLPAAIRRRVHLVCVPMTDPDEAATIVNALQRHATVVVQKSLAEGFGLTVTEGMWKERPVVGSAVGGIVDQVLDGETGFLVEPEDLDQFGNAVCARSSSRPRRRISSASRLASVCGTGFLGDRHLEQWAELFAVDHLSGGRPPRWRRVYEIGGGEGDRTHYLLHAMQALYQLSYAPEGTLTLPAGSRSLGSRPLASPRDERADDIPQHRYTAALANEIEHTWQDRWDAEHVFWTPNRTGLLRRGPARHRATGRSLFVLDMFPYPSGVGPPRRPPARLHRDRRVRALPAHDRLQRAARDGLRRVRSARRAVRGADRHAPARHDRSRTSPT